MNFIIKKEEIYNKTVFFIEILTSLLFGISIFNLGYIRSDYGYLSIPYIILAIISFITIGIILVVNVEKYKKQVEKMFLTFIIPIGIMFVILLPVG